MGSLWSMLLAAVVLAITPAGAAPPKPLFDSDDILHLTIRAPSSAFRPNAAARPTPIAATLMVAGSDAALPITLNARGITRREHDVCQFPPLRVIFTDKPAAGSPFAGQKKLKLVTHCRAPAAFQQYLLLEYTAYRLYNQITPQSFRVRLAEIDYVDAGGKPVTSRLGFFLEDVKDVAARNGLSEIKAPSRVPIGALDHAASARDAVFQYLIGNLDWAMNAGPQGTACCHNSKLIGSAGATSGLIPVPYDYDFSGMVDAPYAVPPDGVPVANVRVRRYRGFCSHNPEAHAAIRDLVARRDALLGTLDRIPQLEEPARSKARAYLAGFLDRASDEKALLRTCL